MVAEVGHYIVHDINQQWDHPLLLIAVEHHVQQMSQHLKNTFSNNSALHHMLSQGMASLNESRILSLNVERL